MVEPKILVAGIRNVKFGENVTIVEPVNLYECEIGESSFVGPYCEIQSGVKIGSNTKIQSHSFICSLVEIGRRVFIGHGVVFVNDLFTNGGPARGDKSKWKATFIEDDVSIGSNCTILPVRIVKGCVVGAGSTVTKDLLQCGVYAGNPAKLIRKLSNE